LAPAKDKIPFHLVKISLKLFWTSGGANSGIRKMPVLTKFAHDIFGGKNTEFTGFVGF
jgi:hypothetical protein